MSKKHYSIKGCIHNDQLYKQARELREYAETTAAILQSLPATFSATLVAHMQRCNMTVEQLSEKSLLSASSIHNFRTGKTGKVSFKSVMALCIGLQLNLCLSKDLLLKAGYVFQNTSREVLCTKLVESCYCYSIHDCNMLLLLCGFDLLVSDD